MAIFQAGILNNAVGLKSNASKDVRGSSPEVMEMNVDLLSMGVANNGPDTALTPHAPTNSNAHGINLISLFVLNITDGV